MINKIKSIDKRNKILIQIIIISLFTIIITTSYAYFTASVSGNNLATDNVITAGNMALILNDGVEVSLPDAIPGSSITKTFSVKNIGDVTTNYDIYLSEVLNTFSNKEELVYEVTSTKGCEKEETVVPSKAGDNSKIVNSCSIEPNAIHEYNLIITFKETNKKQNSNLGRIFQGKISVNEYHDIFVANIVDTDQTLSTVDVLKNTNLSVGQTVTTRGYNSVDDGGSASYTIESKTTQDIDGGKYIELNNGNVAKLMYNGIVSLKQYGAKGNGVDDDSIATKNAVKYLANNEILYVPEGDYVLKDQVTIENRKQHTKIIGAGANSRFIAAVDRTDQMMFAIYNPNDLVFSNLTFDGNLENRPEGGYQLLFIWGSNKVTIDECNFHENKNEAIVLALVDNNFSVSNSDFRNTDCGVIAMGEADIHSIDNFIFENNRVEGHQNSEPISLFGKGQYSNIYINNNVFLNKKYAGAIYLAGNNGGTDGVLQFHNVEVTNNTIKNFSAGIEVKHAENVLIANNEVDNYDQTTNDKSGSSGMTIGDVSNIEIKNNYIYKTWGFGMKLDSLRDANIEQNTIKDSGYSNMNFYFVNALGNNANFNFHNNTLIREDNDLYEVLMTVHGDGSNNVRFVDNTFTNGKLRLWTDSSNIYVKNSGNVINSGTNNTIIND